ncbi:MAG: PD-(D/E)XK nuclease family protein [Anaerovoracaceae bacterium]
MNTVFYGRDHVNKTKYLFDNIKGKTLLLVPDQYTLQAERDAFNFLKTEGLIDLEVLSFGRLGNRVIAETGMTKPLISKEGRHMLLTKILEDNDDRFIEYKGYKNNNGFIEMVNNMISEMKQFNTTPDTIKEYLDSKENHELLEKKLSDMAIVFEEYEKLIGDKYIDTEDLIDLVARRIENSKWLLGQDVWITGFDYFTEKNLKLIKALMNKCNNVNVILSYEKGNSLFHIGWEMIEKLRELDSDFALVDISTFEKVEASNTMKAIEEKIFDFTMKPSDIKENIVLVKAANPHGEAETAAEHVLHLVRDKGYKYNEITLVCNDLEGRGKICKRVFKDYGMDLFLDNKRDILYSPLVGLVLAVLDIILGKYRREDVIRYLKTGLVIKDDNLIEELENYVRTYKIRGSLWKKAFVKGSSEYGEDLVNRVESLRVSVMATLEEFEKEFKGAKRVKDQAEAIYELLAYKLNIPAKLEELIREQLEDGMVENAEETAQVWNVFLGILRQQIELIGDEKLGINEYVKLITAGINSVEIGLLPPTIDGLVMGTIQRSRPGQSKAIVIVGANEGVLPGAIDDSGILNRDEKEALASKGLYQLESIRLMEENLAIYRNLASSSNELFISCAAGDSEGNGLFPSTVFTSIKEMFPNVPIINDIINREDSKDLVVSRDSTFAHLVDNLQRSIEGEQLEEIWKYVFEWFRGGKEFYLLDSLFKPGERVSSMGEDNADALYREEALKALSLSPSRLEKFGKCPFAHFVQYGLKPKIRNDYEILPLDAGNLYHFVMMKVAENLSSDKKKNYEEDSKWMKASNDELLDLVSKAVDLYAKDYREGILIDSYKTKWFKDVCFESVKMMVEHVRLGRIESMKFEEPFGRGKSIKEIVIPGGNKVVIEGIIDRIDILENQSVKIVDYKSGADKFDETEMREGWKFQLFVYLKAAIEEEKEPAGAFYFHIKDGFVKADEIAIEVLEEKVKSKRESSFKMDGAFVGKDSIVQGIDSKLKIVTNKKKAAMDEEEFKVLFNEVMDKVNQLANQLAEGDIRILPLKYKDKTPCGYCQYKGVCKFDITLDNCKYKVIRKKDNKDNLEVENGGEETNNE